MQKRNNIGLIRNSHIFNGISSPGVDVPGKEKSAAFTI